MWRLLSILPCVACVLSPLSAQPHVLPPLKALFHVGFDGNAQADAGSAEAPSGAEKLKYVEGKSGQAGDFGEGVCVEYGNLSALDPRNGTLELWVHPLHDRKELADHYYLDFLRADGTAIMEVSFSQVEMSAQTTIKSGGRLFRRYGWGYGQSWQHIVVTWDAIGDSPTGLKLYLNGAETGYPASYQPMDVPVRLRVGCRSPQEGLGAKAWLDEITLYNRCLTAQQVRSLTDKGAEPNAQKQTEMAALMAAGDKSTAQRRERLFSTKIGIIYGRNTSLLNWTDKVYASIDIPVPTPVHEDDLAKTALTQYKMLIVPGGGGLNLTDENKAALLEYVRKGGGYVGICGGALTANRCGLVDCQTYTFNVRGPVWVKLKEHPILEGYDLSRMILFPHASGPLFVPKDTDCKTIMVFDVGNPPLPEFTHTVVRELGEGRVVAFSGHPESSADTRPMLRNAVMWTARIMDSEQPQARK